MPQGTHVQAITVICIEHGPVTRKIFKIMHITRKFSVIINNAVELPSIS